MQQIINQIQFKKYSKVSSALKCRLFQCIYIKKLSIKASAKLCKLNYSTAKSIIKNMSEKQENFVSSELNLHEYLLEKQKILRKRSYSCFYKVIDNSEKTKNSSNSQCNYESQHLHYEQNVWQNEKEIHSKPIRIISSIGYDFFDVREEHQLGKSKVNFSNPFECKKGYSCAIDLNLYTKSQSKQMVDDCEEPIRIVCLRKNGETIEKQQSKKSQTVQNSLEQN